MSFDDWVKTPAVWWRFFAGLMVVIVAVCALAVWLHDALIWAAFQKFLDWLAGGG